MDFTLYKQTELEIWINTQYRENDVYYASDINIRNDCSNFDFDSMIPSFNANSCLNNNSSFSLFVFSSFNCEHSYHPLKRNRDHAFVQPWPRQKGVLRCQRRALESPSFYLESIQHKKPPFEKAVFQSCI